MSSENSETRTRILKAAWTLLEASRGRGVKMGDIASAAGVSRQAVYLHFATRADLLIATTHYVDEVNDVAGRLVASRTAASGRDHPEQVDPETVGFAQAVVEHPGEVGSVARRLELDDGGIERPDHVWGEQRHARAT